MIITSICLLNVIYLYHAGLKVDDITSKTDKQLFKRKPLLQYICLRTYMYMHIKVSQNDPNLNTWLASYAIPAMFK